MTARIVIIGSGGRAGRQKTCVTKATTVRFAWWRKKSGIFYERPPLSKATLLEADAPLPRLFSEEVQQALNLRWFRPLRAEGHRSPEQSVHLSNGEQLGYMTSC